MNEKTIVVTGASSGIGRASALHFAENGATVIGVGRNENELKSLESEIKGKNGNLDYY